MNCKKCKKIIEDKSKFCEHCESRTKEQIKNKLIASSKYFLIAVIAISVLLAGSGIFYYFAINLPQKEKRQIELTKIASDKALAIEEARIQEEVKKQEEAKKIEEQLRLEKQQAEEAAAKEQALIIKKNTAARNSCLQSIKDKYNKLFDDVADDYSPNTDGLSPSGIQAELEHSFAAQDRAEKSIMSAYERAKSDCYAKYPVNK